MWPELVFTAIMSTKKVYRPFLTHSQLIKNTYILPTPVQQAKLHPIKWRTTHLSIWHRALFWSIQTVGKLSKLPSMTAELHKNISFYNAAAWEGLWKHSSFLMFFYDVLSFLLWLWAHKPVQLITKVRNENHLMSANSHTFFSARIPSAIIMSSWITHYLSILITHFLFSSWQQGPGTQAADLYRIPVRQI